MMNKLNNSGFVGLVCLLLAIVIVAFLFMSSDNRYFAPSTSTQNEIKAAYPGPAPDTSSYSSVLESTKQKIKVIEQQGLQRPNEIMQEMDKLQSP